MMMIISPDIYIVLCKAFSYYMFHLAQVFKNKLPPCPTRRLWWPTPTLLSCTSHLRGCCPWQWLPSAMPGLPKTVSQRPTHWRTFWSLLSCSKRKFFIFDSSEFSFNAHFSLYKVNLRIPAPPSVIRGPAASALLGVWWKCSLWPHLWAYRFGTCILTRSQGTHMFTKAWESLL